MTKIIECGLKEYWLGDIQLSREQPGPVVWVLRDEGGKLIGHYADDVDELKAILEAHGRG